MDLGHLVTLALRELAESTEPHEISLLERLLSGAHSQEDLRTFADRVERLSRPLSSPN